MFRKNFKKSSASTPQTGRETQESFDYSYGAAQTPSSVNTRMERFDSSKTPSTKSQTKMNYSPKPISPKKTVDNTLSQSYFKDTTNTSKNFVEKEHSQSTIVNPSTVDNKMSKSYKTASNDKTFTAPKPVVQVKAKDIPKAPAKQLIIGAGVMVKADITEADLVLIEGCVEGTINAKCIMILDGGSVLGEATCDVAYIAGVFTGPKLITSEKLQVGSTGKIKASISYNIISMDAGAVVTGMIVNCPPKVEEVKVEEKTDKPEESAKENLNDKDKESEKDTEKPINKDTDATKDSPTEDTPTATQPVNDAPTPLS